MRPLPLRLRLALVQTAVLAALVAGFGVAAYRVLAAQLDAAATADLAELTDGLHGYFSLKDDAPALTYDRSDAAEANFIETATRFYQVYDASTGVLLTQSSAMEPLALRFTPLEVQTYLDRTGPRDITTDQGRLRFSNTVVRLDNAHVYLLQVGVLLRGMDRALAQFRQLLLWGVPIGVVLATALGWWLAGRALSPMRRLAAEAGSIGVDALSCRLTPRGSGDELDQVADAFNLTLARLEHSVGEMRQFSAALAHELRAPLAALRAEIESLLLAPRSTEEYQRGLISQLEEMDTLTRLVSQLLTLARAEAGEIRLAKAPVDLGALADSLYAQLEPVAEAKGVRFEVAAQPGVMVLGDAGWLERLAITLIDNAITFTPAGGTIHLSAREVDGHPVLAVRDTGIGIAAADVPHLFERFYRVDDARSPRTDGAGLGLTLAKWIADHHDARIDVVSAERHGSTLTVVFPAASRA